MTRSTLPLLALLLALTACSVRQTITKGLAGALASSGHVFASDEDPELVRDALPFALKTIETLLAESPQDTELLLAATTGFTQYAYAFLESEADRVEQEDYEQALHLRARALAMYLRAQRYALRALDVRYPGLSERLRREPDAAASELGADDLDLLYWTAASWGAAMSVGVDRPDVLADLDAVRALFRRALELDESYDAGGLHAALISIEALPAMMGGSHERARFHFERAVELSGGTSIGPYIGYAKGVLVAQQDRAAFEATLNEALTIDPDSAPSKRLANTIDARRAQALLEAADDLFLEPLE